MFQLKIFKRNTFLNFESKRGLLTNKFYIKVLCVRILNKTNDLTDKSNTFFNYMNFIKIIKNKIFIPWEEKFGRLSSTMCLKICFYFRNEAYPQTLLLSWDSFNPLLFWGCHFSPRSFHVCLDWTHNCYFVIAIGNRLLEILSLCDFYCTKFRLLSPSFPISLSLTHKKRVFDSFFSSVVFVFMSYLNSAKWLSLTDRCLHINNCVL